MPGTTEIDYNNVEVIKKVKEEVAHVRWTINNFTATYESARGEVLESDEFDIEDNSFTLKLCCPGSFDDDSFSLGLNQYIEEGEGPICIKSNAWIEDLDGNKYFEVELEDSGRDEDLVYYDFKDSFTKQDLGTKIKLQDDVAILCCKVKKHMPGEEITLPKFALELPQKLWNSYQQGLIDSITIQVEGKELKVSKNILAANSDVFERMLLTSNCKELQEGIIKISEVSFEIMKSFIEYLHRGEINNLPDICEDLFVLADRYMVTQLQEDCVKEMIESLTKKNLFTRLHMAFLYDQQDLKNAALNYVTKQESDLNFRQILVSTQWISFSFENVSLAQEIVNAVYDKMQLFPEQKDDEVQNKRQRMN